MIQKKAEGNASPRSNKSSRLSVVLSANDRQRIDRLVEMMEADTVTDVTKDAFRLLEYFITNAQKGNKFLIQEPGGEPSKIEVFGVTT